MVTIKHRIALDLAKSTLANKLAKHPLHKHFKVGKTTQTLDERFSQNYKDKYDGIDELYNAGSDGALVDWLEEQMIAYCLDTFGKRECDNDQVGGGPTCEDNADKDNPAKLYLVWR